MLIKSKQKREQGLMLALLSFLFKVIDKDNRC
jgi:hypothetical protein